MLRVVLLLAAAAAAAAAPTPKQLGGPPEEFAQHVIPDPANGGVASRAATYWVKLQPAGADGQVSWTTRMPLDSHGFQFAVFSPELSSLTVELRDPTGAVVPLSSYEMASGYPVGDSSAYDKAVLYSLPNMTCLGVFTLTLSAPAAAFAGADPLDYDAYVLLQSESQDLLYTRLASYECLLQGKQVTLLAQMFDSAQQPFTGYGFRPRANANDTILSAELQARFPDGHWETTEMHDDGLHGDGAADDGEFGGALQLSQAGNYQLQAAFHGKNAAGEFVRVSEHLLTVVPPSVQLTGRAIGQARVLQHRLDMHLLLSTAARGVANGTRYRAYAEVWAPARASGQLTPVTWASSMVQVHTVLGRPAVTLEIDLKWLLRAKVKLPLTLKNVYLQDATSFVPVTTADSIGLQVRNEGDLAALDSIAYDGVSITREMRQGITPDHILKAAASNSSPRLVLVHGYCSSQNPWLNTKSLWPADALYFEDVHQARPHDEFARLILEFIEANNVDKCAFVGHSQGGIVTSHILNSYFTCADANDRPGRKHTSLGSPYLGCTGAGGYADLLRLLGGCGSNFDLTPDGANLWSTGMSADTWANVHYYTTRAKPGLFNQNGYCNAITNIVLHQPNDGVTEQIYAEPPLANNHGLSDGECHVEGMHYPASFLDTDRNQEILQAMAL